MKNIMWKSKFIALPIIIFIVIVFANIEKQTAVANSLENEILRFNSKYPQDDELASLPKSCSAKRMEQKVEFGESPNIPKLDSFIKAYKKRLGDKRWHSYHHYCAGLMRVQRYTRSKQAGIGINGLTDLQRKTLIYATKEFEYSNGYVGYPEYIIAKKLTAAAFWDIGDFSEAFKTLNTGIRADPKQPALYVQLAKYLITLGKVDQAKKVLQKGAKSTSNNKQIRALLSTLK